MTVGRLDSLGAKLCRIEDTRASSTGERYMTRGGGSRMESRGSLNVCTEAAGSKEVSLGFG